jgi:hypothetical protein
MQHCYKYYAQMKLMFCDAGRIQIHLTTLHLRQLKYATVSVPSYYVTRTCRLRGCVQNFTASTRESRMRNDALRELLDLVQARVYLARFSMKEKLDIL